MTEKLTPIEILKSKQNFSNFMADTPAFIVSTLADYPQAAKEQWRQRAKNTISTALKDQPTIVESPKGGYSVVPHKIATINKLKIISPYRISDDD